MKKKFSDEIMLEPLSNFKDGDIVVPIDFIVDTDKYKDKLIYAGSHFSLIVAKMINHKGKSVNRLRPFYASPGDSISASCLFLIDHPKINNPDWESGDEYDHYTLFSKIGETIEIEFNNTRHFGYRSDFYIYNGKKYKAIGLPNGKIALYRIDGDFPFIHIVLDHGI